MNSATARWVVVGGGKSDRSGATKDGDDALNVSFSVGTFANDDCSFAIFQASSDDFTRASRFSIDQNADGGRGRKQGA